MCKFSVKYYLNGKFFIGLINFDTGDRYDQDKDIAKFIGLTLRAYRKILRNNGGFTKDMWGYSHGLKDIFFEKKEIAEECVKKLNEQFECYLKIKWE